MGWKEGREYINSAWGGWLGKGSDEKSECPREWGNLQSSRPETLRRKVDRDSANILKRKKSWWGFTRIKLSSVGFNEGPADEI